MNIFFKNKPKITVDSDKVEHFLSRGVEAVFPNKEYIKAKMQNNMS